MPHGNGCTISAQEHMQRHGPFSTEVNAWITQEVQETKMCDRLGIKCPHLKQLH